MGDVTDIACSSTTGRADPLEDRDLHEFLHAQGYAELKHAGAALCGLQRQLFTTGLVVALTAEGYERRYCYERREDARRALAAWDGRGHPGGPWIKCKGAGIGVLNPELCA